MPRVQVANKLHEGRARADTNTANRPQEGLKLSYSSDCKYNSSSRFGSVEPQ